MEDRGELLPPVEAEMDDSNEEKPSKRKLSPSTATFPSDVKDNSEMDMQHAPNQKPTRRRREEGIDAGAVNEWESKNENDSLNDLLKTFANMAIPKNDHETCPLCFNSFKLEEFSDHVHKCLEKMESNIKTECSLVSDGSESHLFSGGECKFGLKCKITNADHFRFMEHPKVECPICSDKFHMHEINAHINFCLDKGGDQEMKEDTAKSAAESADQERVEMSTQQMAACAKAILDAKSQNSDVSLVSMLQRFKSLGFTRENLKNRLKKIEADKKEIKMSPTLPEAANKTESSTIGFDLKPPSFTFDDQPTSQSESGNS
eukprot:CAMPEP_0167789532 /NCGR_PEP_ID=MMETSP0111_2-20121227/10747_1 /TAXON_ID=91324 /ORGANISM="Lotharella globosa, Strain CCCM811" /LENGTH=317 /DNA_ID=CAMNT_0007681729 /DNA_START=29 /DNA_END=982 /DNA_ORIENTATION=+